MQFLVIFTSKAKFATTGPPSDFPQRALEEQQQIRTLYRGGGLRQIWALTAETRGAALIFEADSREQLQELIDTLPFVKLDYAEYQTFALGPYPGFAEPA